MPLDGTEGRRKRKPLYTFILSNLRDFNKVQVALIHGALYKGSKNYPQGLRVGDLLTEFKVGQFVEANIPGKLLASLIQSYNDSGDKHKWIQTDDSVEFVKGTNKIETIGGKPLDDNQLYDVLFPLDLAVLRDEPQKSLVYNDFCEYFKANPKHLNFNPHHQPPVISKSIACALIKPDWVELFRGHTFSELDTNKDGTLDIHELKQMVGSEEVAVALMERLDTNQDGVFDRAELAVLSNSLTATTN